MKQYTNQYFDGERPLFAETNADISGTTFGTGESPLKESRNIHLTDSIFTYQIPTVVQQTRRGWPLNLRNHGPFRNLVHSRH